MKTLIIIPAYNEAGGIEKVIDNISGHSPQYDYIIVNDGSKDQTKNICRQKRYNILNLPINLGIGGAVQTGYKYALENKYDIAVQMDGDGQHDAAFIEKLIQPIIEGNANIVIGSRFIERKGFQSSGMRRAGIFFLSSLIRILTGKRVWDVTSGFRAVDKRFIEVYASEYSRDYPEPEAIVTAVMYRGKIAEVPVVMNARENGISSINTWKAVYYMIKVTLAVIVRRISYGFRRQKGE